LNRRHGLYEHSNSNAIIARFFSNHGYDVLSFDLRGHGKSEGIKGFLENQKVILEDINNFISITENEYNNETSINKFIIGYSLGGLMANLICLEKTNYFNGMILIAPAFHGEAEKKYSFWVKFARVLNKVAPSLSLLKIKGK
jgi:acylglycerol lipase